MPPLFITFEGLDGSGKSTHLRWAVEWLAGRGIEIEQTHEPGGTPLGDALRAAFLDAKGSVADGVVELMLVFTSRRQNLLARIEPALAAGRTVVCDRFTDSTYAYQGFGRGVPAETIAALDRIATGERRPDFTLLFDLPPEEARRRSHSSRRQAKAEGTDRLDAEDLAFYRRVREGYLELAALEAERFRVIDSRGPHGETAAQVRQVLEELFPEAPAGVPSGRTGAPP
jgi:dTMP kinase